MTDNRRMNEHIIAQESAEEKDGINMLQLTPEQLKNWQESDPSLKKVFEAAKNPEGGYAATFFIRDGLQYRKWSPVKRSSSSTDR